MREEQDSRKLQPLNDALRQETSRDFNPSTAWRWVRRGIAGPDGERIKLKCWYIGRAPFTSAAAVREFIDAVTAARSASIQHPRGEVTDAELAAVGLHSPKRS